MKPSVHDSGHAMADSLPRDSGDDGAPLAVTIDAVDDLAKLESEWRLLEGGDGFSFFQTWEWMGSLLEALPQSAWPRVLKVTARERVVGLGLLSPGSDHRRGIIRTRTFHLNETGIPEYDSITMEHNGLLTLPGYEQTAVDAAVAYLSRQAGWDELYLGGLLPDHHARWVHAASQSGLWDLTRWEKPHYAIDLDAIRCAKASYMDSLSANTRYQIRRARKLYGARGELVLRHAGSFEEADAWFQELLKLHQSYWAAKSQPGAFASDHARAFHRAMLQSAWPRQAVELVQVKAGNHLLGYLYNFRKGDTLYNYQSGFAYEEDAKLKPGLVCHALAAEDALRRGVSVYDLLAGGGHYKQSLTNATGTMIWAILQKKRWVLGLENQIRRARNSWDARRNSARRDSAEKS